MSLVIDTPPVPLRIDQDGVARIGGTRVTLDTIVTVYQQGTGPEDIGAQFPAVSLADIYAVLAYYLRHRAEVDAYLDRRNRQAQAVQQENESRFPREGVRERLLSRRSRGPQ